MRASIENAVYGVVLVVLMVVAEVLMRGVGL
jgi:hypothetical protein